MLLTTPDPVSRTVVDYDFVFSDGTPVSITLSPSDGDRLHETAATYDFSLTPKVNPFTPTEKLPAVRIIHFKAHLFGVRIRERVEVDQTLQQRQDFTDTLKTIVAELGP